MARPKMQKPVNFTASIQTLYEIVASFSDDKSLGQFFRKAVSDLSNGCSTKNVDIRIKTIYDNASKKLATQQNKQKNYNDKRKISGSGKPHGSEATTSNPICKDLSYEPCLPLNVVEKRKYGESGLVQLNDIQAAKLKQLYGTDFDTAITVLECYIENNNRGKKYKDHYKVLAKGNWVYDKIQQMKLTQQRIENAQRGQRNWKAEERERTARALRGESIDGKNYVKDEDLTIEEFRRKYG